MKNDQRTFIAIKLPDEIQKQITEFEDSFRVKTGFKGRLIASEKIHITIKFLGDTNLEKFDEIKDRLNMLTEKVGKFKLKIKGVGVFPNLHRARILWLGIEELPDELLKLKKEIEKFISPLGFPEEKRRFKPHLTLSRLKKKLHEPEVDFIKNNHELSIGEFQVNEIEFIKSTLDPKGAIYETIEAFKLKKNRE